MFLFCEQPSLVRSWFSLPDLLLSLRLFYTEYGGSSFLRNLMNFYLPHVITSYPVVTLLDPDVSYLTFKNLTNNPPFRV
jgi:hypothetical protein